MQQQRLKWKYVCVYVLWYLPKPNTEYNLSYINNTVSSIVARYCSSCIMVCFGIYKKFVFVSLDVTLFSLIWIFINKKNITQHIQEEYTTNNSNNGKYKRQKKNEWKLYLLLRLFSLPLSPSLHLSRNLFILFYYITLYFWKTAHPSRHWKIYFT